MSEAALAHLRISVIVASQQRVQWLQRCLKALRQQDYPAFEIIVVADHRSLDQIDQTFLKCVPFEEANLSRARNLGINASGGEICAFIDDDAVAEPMWLHHLEFAFRQTGAAAVAGYVRGRNGISFQSRAQSVDAEAETHEEEADPEHPTIPELASGRAVKLVGTNMAFRREVLDKLGGFDPLYRFFLEDSDLSLRLMLAGFKTAIAPLAQVHHGTAASPRRTTLRAPLDLFDIGRSTAIYLRRHHGHADPEILQRARLRERGRLLRHLVAGSCEPGHLRERLRTLETGWKEGESIRLTSIGETVDRKPFEPFPQFPSGHEVFASPMLLRRRKLFASAERAVENGARASVISFSLTPFRHHVRYTDAGFWAHTGGLYGRSRRSDAVFRWCRFAQRLQEELCCVAKTRGIGDTHFCNR